MLCVGSTSMYFESTGLPIALHRIRMYWFPVCGGCHQTHRQRPPGSAKGRLRVAVGPPQLDCGVGDDKMVREVGR